MRELHFGNGIDLSKLSLRVVFQNASGLDTGRETKLNYESTTEADKNYGCKTASVLNKIVTPRACVIKNLNLLSDQKQKIQNGGMEVEQCDNCGNGWYCGNRVKFFNWSIHSNIQTLK